MANKKRAAGLLTKQTLIGKEVSKGFKDTAPKVSGGQLWEELESLYAVYTQNMVNIMSKVEESISVEGLYAYITEKETYTTAINTLTADVDRFTDRLLAIHEKHKDRRGHVLSDNDLALFFSIGGEYTVLFEQFQGLTIPTIVSITDMIIEAKERYDEAQQTQTSSTEGSENVQ